MSKSDRADQPFNSGGGGAAAAPSAREGQGQHYKKIVKALRARTKKGTTQARRAHQARAPPTAVHRRGTGRRTGAPALAQATTVGPLHSPGLGERKAEKKK